LNLYSLHICPVVTNCSSILYLSPDLEAKKAAEAKAKKEEEKEESARYASIAKAVAKAKAERAAGAAAAAEMAAAEKSTDTDDVQSMDVDAEKEAAVHSVQAPALQDFHEVTVWECDMCKSATFNTYEEAVEHELTCSANDTPMELSDAAAAAAEMAAAEESTATDDVQTMDIEEDAVVAKVLAADLAGAQQMDLSDESDTQMGEEVEDGPDMQMIDAGDDGAEDGAGLFAVLFVYT